MVGGIPVGDAILWGIVTFSILVVLHEAGHFVAARLFGVKVHEFMIGLPGPAIRVKTKRTTFGVTAVPLGGYVRIAGMEPGAEDELLAAALGHVTNVRRSDASYLAATLKVSDKRASALLMTLADWGAIAPAEEDDVSYVALMERDGAEGDAALLSRARSVTFRGRKTWQRIVILAAGVLVNLTVAIGVFTTFFALWGYYEGSLTIESVRADSAAQAAGLRAGDTLVSLGGQRLASFEDLVMALGDAGPGSRVDIEYVREGRTIRTSAVLQRDGMRAVLGISSQAHHVPLTFFQALRESLIRIGMVFQAIADFFRPGMFGRAVKRSTGLVGISLMSAEAAKGGALDYVWLIAVLSLSLGVMNLLPIPPLDGGKVVLELIERALGHPLRREVTLSFSAVGALFLMSLIGYLMYSDVVRYVAAG